MLLLTVLAAGTLANPRTAAAAPDPTLAVVLSAASTTVPLLVTGALWVSQPGPRDDTRFGIGMASLGIGAIVGPSIGQIYAQGGGEAWLTFFLRGATGAVMLAGTAVLTRGDREAQAAGGALLAVGGIPCALLALYDIISAGSRAREVSHRQGHGASRSPWEGLDLGQAGNLSAATLPGP